METAIGFFRADGGDLDNSYCLRSSRGLRVEVRAGSTTDPYPVSPLLPTRIYLLFQSVPGAARRAGSRQSVSGDVPAGGRLPWRGVAASRQERTHNGEQENPH